MDARAPQTPDQAKKTDVPVQRVILVSMLAIFATTLLMRAVDPLVPQLAGYFVVDPHTVALLATAFSLPYAITQPVLGGLADAFGKTQLMTWSLVILVISAVIGAVAPNLPVLFVSRVVSGVMAGGVFPIAVAIAADLVSIERRQIAVGRMLGAAMIGNVLGSPASGIAADLIGWRGVFIGMAVLCVVAVVAAAVGFRGVFSGAVARVDIRRLPTTYAEIFRNPLAKFCYGAVMIEAIALFGLFPYVAGLLAAAGEPRAAIAGVVIGGFGVGGIIYSSSIAILIGRLGERRLMIGGGSLLAASFALVALRLPWPLQAVDFIFVGLGFYMMHGVIQIYASELAPKARGSAMAMHSASFFFGNAIGPVVYGWTLPRVGLAPTVLTAAAILLGVGLVCARKLRRERPA